MTITTLAPPWKAPSDETVRTALAVVRTLAEQSGLVDALTYALADPGRLTGRRMEAGFPETLARWEARAVALALTHLSAAGVEL